MVSFTAFTDKILHYRTIRRCHALLAGICWNKNDAAGDPLETGGFQVKFSGSILGRAGSNDSRNAKKTLLTGDDTILKSVILASLRLISTRELRSIFLQTVDFQVDKRKGRKLARGKLGRC
jgi:hypothetical protein